ncbi:MAG: (Fe-S)-binding protein [Desulfohalobiaceae bacterium]|nr:(Fe-S)-binding protein [Desulfohalobiaceae bacterium]
MPTSGIHECNKCGLCLVNCPVYRESREEPVSPRAKVQLIKHYWDFDLPGSAYLKDLISTCLMCGNCTATCPSGVEHDVLFSRMRFEMIQDYGQEWSLKALFHFLSHEQQLRFAAKMARFGRSLASKRLLNRYKLGAISLERTPPFNPVPFRRQWPRVNEPDFASRGTVLYFTGCATNHVYADVGRSVVAVLLKMGFRVEIPANQVCCGMPFFLNGRPDRAGEMIEKNLHCLNREDIEAVVVDCATCGSALRKEYPRILSELGLSAEAAKELSTRVRDVSEFIADRLDLINPLLRESGSRQIVTYHAPCHLRNWQGIGPHGIEKLLSCLPGVEYKAVADRDRCCGGGGSFFLKHPEISKGIVSGKIASIENSGASVLATGCPSCRVNFAGNMDQPVQVLHPVQLVEACLQ